jgi:rfaE bifunctional protein kinase chain/domain
MEIFSPISTKFIGIVGDVMLDRYIWGNVNRISQEAPVPVVDVELESNHPGGAANVALNLRALGATPVLFGAVGDDSNAENIRRIFEENRIASDFLITDAARRTTVKTRVIAGSQHVVRIDRENRNYLSAEIRHKLMERFEAHIGSMSVIILQDYNKGVISEELIGEICALAKERNIPVCVDPKFQNFFNYRRVSVFKPNRKETEDALKRKLTDEESFIEAAKSLQEALECENLLMTLGELGMLLRQQDGSVFRIATKARKVADVSGAGDTVIATLAATMACGATMLEAAQLANIAAGLVCEEVGIVPIQHDALVEAALGDGDQPTNVTQV